MEPVTHALSGAVLRNLGFKRKASLGVLVFSAMAPDLDFITRLWGADVFLRYHRGLTHGILGLLVVPAIIGMVFRKRGGFTYYWLISALGYGLHLGLDLTNHYGTRFLSPLDWRLLSADLTFIVDPYLLGGFALSLVITCLNRDRARVVAVSTMAMMVLYLGAKQYYHEKTEEFLRASMDEYIIETVIPLPNDFLRWWFIAENESEIKTGFADLFTRSVCFHKTYPKQGYNQHIERSKNLRVVKNFLYFAQYPYAEVRQEGETRIVKWKELAYSFSRGEHFTLTVKIDARGNLISSKIKI